MPRHPSRLEIGRGSSRHRAPRNRLRRGLLALALAGVIVAAGTVVADDRLPWPGTWGAPRPGEPAAAEPRGGEGGQGCVGLEVASTAIFLPVLAAAAQQLATGEDCVKLDLTSVEGSEAGRAAAERGADAWVTDDVAWAAFAPKGFLAREEPSAVVATSPVHLVAGPAEAALLRQQGGTWLALAGLVADSARLRLVVPDPQSSAAGMVAVAGLGEAVWMKSGMDPSAAALARAFPRTRTVASAGEVLPPRPGEVALVPEFALVTQRNALRAQDVVLAPADRTAQLRVSLFTAARAEAEPAKAAALVRLQGVLGTSVTQGLAPSIAAALDRAGLRRPDGPPPRVQEAASGAGGETTLPQRLATPFPVFKPHHVDHVLAVWYPRARRANALLVMDVSGSMGRRLPGGGTLIEAARAGSARVTDTLPDDAVLGLWKFGTRLDGHRDHVQLVPQAPLSSGQRAAVHRALGDLWAQRTGTGLYDTVLAAYRTVAASSRPGIPNHVLVFTDGRNESDRNSVSIAALAEELAAQARSGPPISVVVLTYGVTADAAELNAALKPVGGAVRAVRTAEEVEAAFLHFAAGGLHPDE